MIYDELLYWYPVRQTGKLRPNLGLIHLRTATLQIVACGTVEPQMMMNTSFVFQTLQICAVGKCLDRLPTS